ncbi:MAG: bifunctional 4-hydroxy-2-oxoglutarate aldolase/2-dehydro-3-deoxy-phosphogluconate aldolase [Christensenellaceae bacterium]
MMREQIINTIEKEKIIVIVRGVEKEKLIPLAEAMYVGGIRLLEVTYSANGKVSDEETAENISILAKRFEGRMYIGAGTVLTEKQVELTAKVGGKFIISPDTCPEVIRKTRELGLVSMPGALTPSEMQIAHRNGADFVKLFPITSLGASYVKAVKAPLSHLKILAVGGVNENNIAEYLKAGINGFGLGSNIVDKKKIAENDWAGITNLAKKYVSLVK